MVGHVHYWRSCSCHRAREKVFLRTKDERRGAHRSVDERREERQKGVSIGKLFILTFHCFGTVMFFLVKESRVVPGTTRDEKKKGCWEEGTGKEEKKRVKTSKEHPQSMKGNRSKWKQRSEKKGGKGREGLGR